VLPIAADRRPAFRARSRGASLTLSPHTAPGPMPDTLLLGCCVAPAFVRFATLADHCYFRARGRSLVPSSLRSGRARMPGTVAAPRSVTIPRVTPTHCAPSAQGTTVSWGRLGQLDCDYEVAGHSNVGSYGLTVIASDCSASSLAPGRLRAVSTQSFTQRNRPLPDSALRTIGSSTTPRARLCSR